MSFASRAREEIAQRSLQKDCCVRAAAYGFACFAKYFDKGGLVLQTEQPHTVQLARELFARCGVQGDVLEKQRPSGVLYEFNIREPEQVARMHELFGTTGSETSLQIDPALIRCQTCVSAYIGAAFLCSGTVTDPQKEYNLEFLTARTNLARDFEALLAEHEFAPHRTRRNGVNLVYVKNSANLERLLRFMGAAGAAEEIHAQKAFKQVRNQTNRQTNCDTANLGKTARANAQTLRAIRYLQENDALETLPEVLQQAAGHLEGSSLPVGGENTHAVISAHRGLPSASLFTDLDQLEKGDHFLISVLDQKLCYEVDQIRTVEPEDTGDLAVEPGEDLVTLLTCTPYGVNTQRLLVRGHRVPYEEEVVEKEEKESPMSLYTNYLLWVVIGLAVTAVLIFGLWKYDKHYKRKRKEKQEQVSEQKEE